MIYFTSDWHFFHDRILEFHPKRKELFGTDMEKTTDKMIELWNNTVSKKDTVYILGKKTRSLQLFNHLNKVLLH